MVRRGQGISLTSTESRWTCDGGPSQNNSMNTLSERLSRLIESRETNVNALESRLEADRLCARNYVRRMRDEGTHDEKAVFYTRLADLLGTTLDYLMAGRGPEQAGGPPPVAQPPPDPLDEEQRLILDLVAQLPPGEAMRRLLVVDRPGRMREEDHRPLRRVDRNAESGPPGQAGGGGR